MSDGQSRGAVPLWNPSWRAYGLGLRARSWRSCGGIRLRRPRGPDRAAVSVSAARVDAGRRCRRGTPPRPTTTTPRGQGRAGGAKRSRRPRRRWRSSRRAIPPRSSRTGPAARPSTRPTAAPTPRRGYEDGATSKLGPSDLRHHEDGRVTIDGEEVDDPEEYKGEPIPGGPTDPDAPPDPAMIGQEERTRTTTSSADERRDAIARGRLRRQRRISRRRAARALVARGVAQRERQRAITRGLRRSGAPQLARGRAADPQLHDVRPAGELAGGRS